MPKVRTQTCEACPYRQDAPSGLWSEADYDKLIGYDAPTYAQPTALFACHATETFVCHGWAVVHSNRGHEYELLALRLHGIGVVPEASVPLFASGAEAAAHGKREVAHMPREAKVMATRLRKRYPRLRKRR